MNFRYEIKKMWFGFWQRYKLKTQMKVASKLLLLFLVIWIIGSLLTIFSQWSYSDNFEGSPFQFKYLQYFWAVIIELVSGYDVGDIEFNLYSKILAVIVVITGLVIFSVFTAQIVSMFIHFLQRIHHLPEKPESFSFYRPIIICGVNNKLPKIIEELRKSPLTKDREIVIIDDEADRLKTGDKGIYKDVWYIKGNQADRNLLENVLGEEETSAIILASDSSGDTRYSDSRAIQTAMAIEAHREKIHTVLELKDDRNIPYLKHTKINEWISVFEYGNKLVSQATLQHGMGNVYHYLLGVEGGNRKANRIFFTGDVLPHRVVGRSYKEMRDMIITGNGTDITLIGFARYVSEELQGEFNLESGESCFIKQINPISRICRSCSIKIENSDRMGRIQNRCSDCLEIERNQDNNPMNTWFFPMDTRLNREDKLIYLAQAPVDLNELF